MSSFRAGHKHPNWNGGFYTRGDGYVMVQRPDHRRTDKWGYIREHILIAEKALGKSLPLGAVIHHGNGNGTDNIGSNLVICENHAYHNLLHQRTRALKACGHASWRKCRFCQQYGDPKNLKKTGNSFYHRDCRCAFRRERYRRTGDAG